MDISILFALASATTFSAASLIFTEISRKVTPLWMNAVKAIGAFILFGACVSLLGTWVVATTHVNLALIVSGILGLAIGDIFLLTAYARMGAARTMILYGFQPLFLGLGGHFFFGQEVGWIKAVAVIFFVACLFTFSLEKFREAGHWEIPGLLAALVGVAFDNSGVLLSRWAFDQVPGMDAMQANVWRCGGAVAFFVVFGLFRKIELRAGWRTLSPRAQKMTMLSIFMGTFLSLGLYLTAIKIGNLATISGIGMAGPIISSTLECLYYKKRPSKYLLVALVLFLIGFAVLTRT